LLLKRCEIPPFAFLLAARDWFFTARKSDFRPPNCFYLVDANEKGVNKKAVLAFYFWRALNQQVENST